jgi:EAL and modified HD-GYP domain-containing signal transduction protein
MQNESMIEKNPILVLAQNRSKIMSSLAKAMNSKSCDIHEASFVGVLSLVDALLRMPIDIILDEINVDNNVRDALLEKTGELGKLLELVIAIERFDMPKTDELLDDLKLTNLQLSNILQNSYIN